jgi:hypothetical protein
MKTEKEIRNEIDRLENLKYKEPKTEHEKEYNAKLSGMIVKLYWTLSTPLLEREDAPLWLLSIIIWITLFVMGWVVGKFG